MSENSVPLSGWPSKKISAEAAKSSPTDAMYVFTKTLERFIWATVYRRYKEGTCPVVFENTAVEADQRA